MIDPLILSAWLRQYTNHGLWDWLGAAGALILFMTAIVGGIVGLRSFIANGRASSHAHMHTMFLRYLQARDEFSKQLKLQNVDATERPHTARQPVPISSLREDLDFGGTALYLLEEVFAWAEREDRLINSRGYRLLMWRPSRKRRLDIRRRQMDILKSWKATVKTQLITHRQDVLHSLKGYPTCYGADFLDFAANCLADEGLESIAKQSKFAVEAGTDRPAGTEQQKQALEIKTFKELYSPDDFTDK